MIDRNISRDSFHIEKKKERKNGEQIVNVSLSWINAITIFDAFVRSLKSKEFIHFKVEYLER